MGGIGGVVWDFATEDGVCGFFYADDEVIISEICQYVCDLLFYYGDWVAAQGLTV